MKGKRIFLAVLAAAAVFMTQSSALAATMVFSNAQNMEGGDNGAVYIWTETTGGGYTAADTTIYTAQPEDEWAGTVYSVVAKVDLSGFVDAASFYATDDNDVSVPDLLITPDKNDLNAKDVTLTLTKAMLATDAGKTFNIVATDGTNEASVKFTVYVEHVTPSVELNTGYRVGSHYVNDKAVYDNPTYWYTRLNVNAYMGTYHPVDTAESFTVKNANYGYQRWPEKDFSGTVEENKDITFDLSAIPRGHPVYYALFPQDYAGDKINHEFMLTAENGGLNGKDYAVTFGTSAIYPGATGKLPTYRSLTEQMASYVPYAEIVRDANGAATAVICKIVNPSNPSVALTKSAGGAPDVRRIRTVQLYSGTNSENESWVTLVNKENADYNEDVAYVDFAEGATLSATFYVANNHKSNPALTETDHVEFSYVEENDVDYRWYFDKKEGTPDTSSGGGCNAAGFGLGSFALMALAALPMFLRKKK